MSDIYGLYVGRTMVRPGRESELTKPELKRYAKDQDSHELLLSEDGTFWWKRSTEGTYAVLEGRVRFSPTRFGGQTKAEMRRRAEDQGREFGLAFIFDPFELRLEGDELITPELDTVVYTVYRRVG